MRLLTSISEVLYPCEMAVLTALFRAVAVLATLPSGLTPQFYRRVNRSGGHDYEYYNILKHCFLLILSKTEKLPTLIDDERENPGDYGRVSDLEEQFFP